MWHELEEVFFAACMLSFYLFVIVLLWKGSARSYAPPEPDSTDQNIPFAGELPYRDAK